MDELRRRLQEVVETRFDGKARRASINAGLNPNQMVFSSIYSNRPVFPLVGLVQIASFRQTCSVLHRSAAVCTG